MNDTTEVRIPRTRVTSPAGRVALVAGDASAWRAGRPREPGGVGGS